MCRHTGPEVIGSNLALCNFPFSAPKHLINVKFFLSQGFYIEYDLMYIIPWVLSPYRPTLYYPLNSTDINLVILKKSPIDKQSLNGIAITYNATTIVQRQRLGNDNGVYYAYSHGLCVDLDLPANHLDLRFSLLFKTSAHLKTSELYRWKARHAAPPAQMCPRSISIEICNFL